MGKSGENSSIMVIQDMLVKFSDLAFEYIDTNFKRKVKDGKSLKVGEF